MMRWLAKALFGLLLILVIGAASVYLLLFRPVAQPATHDLAEVFNHGSIGNEETQGIPYWIWRVLPQVFPEYLPGNQDGYAAFGVMWLKGDPVPIGFAEKTLGVVPRVSPNCAFCHQGSYRLSLSEPAKLVTAGPGTRVDPQAYIRFLIKVGADPRFNAGTLMTAITTIYDMPWWERGLYRFVLIPATRIALKAQGNRFAWMASRPDWAPGRIDPFNPVKFQNLGLSDDGTIGNSKMMPLWSMNEVMPTPLRRFALHWDGLQTDLHETVVSGAIGDGMTYKSVARTEDDLNRVSDFIRVTRAPPSPFSAALPATSPYHLDQAEVDRGRTVFTANCAVCHDQAGARFRTPIPVTEVGTDRHRIDMWTPAALERYTAYEAEYKWGFTHFEKAEGYVATPLAGLWLRGPYLHNGSVPTLQDLLAKPQDRPRTFYRGSDLVDTVKGGFVTEADADPGRSMSLFETRLAGNGNDGHLWGTDLKPDEKAALLAYLKTL